MAKFVDEPMLGERFDLALDFAHEAHRYHVRKGGVNQPYFSHLLGVCAIVLDYGGNEDQAIGALLHDAVEDVKVAYAEIERRFGAEVTAIVRGCTDDVDGDRNASTWDDRKAAHLAHLEREEHLGVLIVVAADKLYNCRCIVRDVRRAGADYWGNFNAGKEKSLAYYTDWLVRVFARVRRNHPDQPVLDAIIEDYLAAVDELKRVVASSAA